MANGGLRIEPALLMDRFSASIILGNVGPGVAGRGTSPQVLSRDGTGVRKRLLRGIIDLGLLVHLRVTGSGPQGGAVAVKNHLGDAIPDAGLPAGDAEEYDVEEAIPTS